MTFQSLQAIAVQTPSFPSDDYVSTGTDEAELNQFLKLNGEGTDLDDLSDDLADAGFVPRDTN